jgi:uncharacterized YccA/Bax inhibitor family protein
MTPARRATPCTGGQTGAWQGKMGGMKRCGPAGRAARSGREYYGNMRGLKIGQMITRTGFLLALVLGVAMFWVAQVGVLLWLHIVGGVIVLVGGFVTTAAAIMAGRGHTAPITLGLTLLVVGAALGVGVYTGQYYFYGWAFVHAALMVAAVGLIEMGAAKVKRALK